MPKQAKKHEILGGIKVSSKQLSEWGKSGGRPKKYKNSAERAKAFRLRKKQLEQGKQATLRNWRSYEEKSTKINSFVRMICDNCHSKSIGGLGHLNQQCSSCFWGRMIEEKAKTIRKRAGDGKERWERWRGKR